jgi:hypothetical protein
MKHRFMIHSLNHTVLMVDISKIGLPDVIFPPDGQEQMVPSLRFQSWRDAEAYLRRLGADQKAIDSAKKGHAAVLTIV